MNGVSAPATSAVRKRRSWWRRSFRGRTSQMQLAVLSAPAMVVIVVMFYIPMVGVIVAFENFQYLGGVFGSPFVGLQNFQFLVDSQTFIQIVRNTLLYNVAFIVLGTALSLSIAVLLFMLRQHRWIVRLYQLVLFLPYFLSFIVIGVIVQTFLSPEYGLVTQALKPPHGQAPNFYSIPSIWIAILIGVQLWQGMGFSSLLYYTGLLGIDPTYYEAAEVDGANRLQITRYVLVPSLAPIIGILLILAIGGLMNANFALFYFVPNNSPEVLSTTEVINTWVYRALTSGSIGPPAAVGLFQSGVGLVLVVVSNLMVRRINPDASLF